MTTSKRGALAAVLSLLTLFPLTASAETPRIHDARVARLSPVLFASPAAFAPAAGCAQPLPYAQPLPATSIRVVPPRFGAVYLFDGGVPIAALDKAGSFRVASGRSYRVTVMQGPMRIWSGDVPATGGVVDLSWAAAPLTSAPFVAIAPPAPPPGLVGLSRDALRGVLGAIDAAPYSREKIAIVRASAPQHLWTIGQARSVLRRIDFEGDKLLALEALAPHLVDPSRGIELISELSFATDRERAIALLGAG